MLKTENQPQQPMIHPAIADYVLTLCRMISVGRLSSSVLHDVRNQLAVISGSVQIIQLKGESIAPSELESRLDNIMVAIDKITQEMNAVGQYGPRSDKAMIDCDLEKIIDDTLLLLRRRIQRSSVSIERTSREEKYIRRLDPGLFEFLVVEIISSLVQVEPTPATLLVITSVEEGFWKLDIVAVPQEGQVIAASTQADAMITFLQLIGKRLGCWITRLFSGYRVSFRYTGDNAVGETTAEYDDEM